VFAVLITVLVLELRPPETPTFAALMALWPTWPICGLGLIASLASLAASSPHPLASAGVATS